MLVLPSLPGCSQLALREEVPTNHHPHGCPHSLPGPLSLHANHPLVESTDEDLDLTEVRALGRLLRPAAFHQHCQLLGVHPDVNGRAEEGLLAVTHLLHDLCRGVANSEHQTSMVGQDLHTRPPTLTFGAQVHALNVEGAVAQSDLLHDDAEAVDISFLHAWRGQVPLLQQLWGCPQLLWWDKAMEK